MLVDTIVPNLSRSNRNRKVSTCPLHSSSWHRTQIPLYVDISSHCYVFKISGQLLIQRYLRTCVVAPILDEHHQALNAQLRCWHPHLPTFIFCGLADTHGQTLDLQTLNTQPLPQPSYPRNSVPITFPNRPHASHFGVAKLALVVFFFWYPMTSSTNIQEPETTTDEENATFIAEHGRLLRPVSHSAFDPFRRHSSQPPVHIDLLSKLLAIILIPMRLLVALVSIVLSYIIVKLFGPVVTKHSITHFEPTLLPRWRRALVEAATKFLGRALLFSLGFWTVEGSDHPEYDHGKAQKATILTNHASLADPCLLAYLYAPAFVAKSDVWRIPGVGRVGAAQHAFYIDRMNNSGISVSQAISDRQRLVDKSSFDIPPVAIFPEGTTTNGRHLLGFRTGAFVAGLPVAPVLIRYEYTWFSPTYESIRTKPYLIGILSQPWNRVRYYRLPIYYPSEEEKKDPKLFAHNVHAMMVRESEAAFPEKLVSSNSNYTDKLEYHAIVRGTKLRKGLQLNLDSPESECDTLSTST